MESQVKCPIQKGLVSCAEEWDEQLYGKIGYADE